MIFGFLTKYRDYRAPVHTGPGGYTSTSYIMNVLITVIGSGLLDVSIVILIRRPVFSTISVESDGKLKSRGGMVVSTGVSLL